MVRGACAVRVKVKKNLFQLAKLGNKTYQSQFYPASCTLHLHTTMTTLEVETECRGTLVATLQPLLEVSRNGIDTQIFMGHIVPKDKSTRK